MAQEAGTGRIAGVVTTRSGQTPMEGVTLVATAAVGSKNYHAMTNAKGGYEILGLRPGEYALIAVFGNLTSHKQSVRVVAGEASRVRVKLDLAKLKSTTYTIQGQPLIEVDDTAQVTRIGRDEMTSLPSSGTSFEDALGMVAGADEDAQGVLFHGSGGPESRYSIDGVDTTGLSHGGVGSPISTEFLDEIEVLTGGYSAEHGRSTGGLVSLTTRTGTNEFHGSIFTQFTNALLQGQNARTPIQSWIDVESNLAYDLTVGGTLGGPIIKDKLWFFVGLQPRLIATDVKRITKRLTDCRVREGLRGLSECEQDETGDFIHADGEPDIDENGDFIYDELDSSSSRSQATEYQFVTKLNYQPSEDHQGQLSLSGTPFTRQDIGVTGESQAVSRDMQVLTTDVSAKWLSKFNDAKTTVEAIVGLHRSTFESGSIDEAANHIPNERLVFGNFGRWAAGMNTSNPGQRRESLATIDGCVDSMDNNKDPYPFIENCPDRGIGYSVGGIGFLQDEEEKRAAGSLSLLQRIEAAGDHQVKIGVDFENNFLNKKRLLSGNLRFTNEQGGRNRIEVFRYVALAPAGYQGDGFSDVCGRGAGGEPVACDYTPAGDVRGHTLNLAGYLQDSWQPVPNLTLNAGVRYEEQRLRNAEHLQGTRAVGTGELLGKNAMLLKNMWAPRLGLLYDWSKQGKSKVYGSWGRYYESIPMDINDRAFGGESWMESSYDSSQCGAVDPNLDGPAGAGCIEGGEEPVGGDLLTGAGILVASGLQAQYLDESILGVELEVAEDLKVGLSYHNRRLGQVLEDLSTDNAQTYVLANPGSWPKAEERKLERRIAGESDPDEKARLESTLQQFRGIRKFDRPRRDYHALSAVLSKRFSRKLFFQTSYTYSKSEGNYQGLYSSGNGQVDPNITSLFDLPELMANRSGPLPQDRPHFFKLDGFYNFDLKRAGELTTGMSLRARSGTPVTATGAHYRYGADETMLLPGGRLGRLEFDYNASIKIGYKRKLGKGMRLETFIDLVNLKSLAIFGGQGTASVDQSYTRSNVNPVVGGRYEDLVYLKELDAGSGAETGRPVQRNQNFGNARSLLAAPAARLTARLTF